MSGANSIGRWGKFRVVSGGERIACDGPFAAHSLFEGASLLRSSPSGVIPIWNMNKSVVPVEIRTVLPFNAGRAVFLGNEEKVFVIYVDESVGAAITMFLNDTPKERPLT